MLLADCAGARCAVAWYFNRLLYEQLRFPNLSGLTGVSCSNWYALRGAGLLSNHLKYIHFYRRFHFTHAAQFFPPSQSVNSLIAHTKVKWQRRDRCNQGVVAKVRIARLRSAFFGIGKKATLRLTFQAPADEKAIHYMHKFFLNFDLEDR